MKARETAVSPKALKHDGPLRTLESPGERLKARIARQGLAAKKPDRVTAATDCVFQPSAFTNRDEQSREIVFGSVHD